MSDRSLPGFSAPYVRMEITEDPADYFCLVHTAADGPGFVSKASQCRYDALTWPELLDVLAALLDSSGRSDGY